MIKASVEMEAVEVELKGRIMNFAAETACLICAVYSAIYEQNREESKAYRDILTNAMTAPDSPIWAPRTGAENQ